MSVIPPSLIQGCRRKKWDVKLSNDMIVDGCDTASTGEGVVHSAVCSHVHTLLHSYLPVRHSAGPLVHWYFAWFHPSCTALTV